jgi:predicted PurR-regulated permease PerM
MPRSHTPQDHRKAIIFLSVLLASTLIITCIIGAPFIKPLIFALIMATVFHPLYVYLKKRTGRDNVAAFLSTAIIFVLIVVPAAFLLNIAAIQAAAVAHGVAAKSASSGGFVPFIAHLLDKPMEILGRFVDISSFNAEEQVSENARTFGLKILPTAATWVGNIFAVIAAVILALITCYFLLRDGDKILVKMLSILPISDEHSERLLQTLKNTIVANVQGVFAVGISQGIATGIALAIMGVSPATLLGILAAFCSIIPVVGTGLIWGPAAIYLIATGHLLKGLILLGIGAGVISMLDNIIRPLIVSSRVQANALVLMLAMLGGVQAFGFLGLFIGPVVIALLVAAGTMLTEELAATRVAHSEEATLGK